MFGKLIFFTLFTPMVFSVNSTRYCNEFTTIGGCKNGQSCSQGICFSEPNVSFLQYNNACNQTSDCDTNLICTASYCVAGDSTIPACNTQMDCPDVKNQNKNCLGHQCAYVSDVREDDREKLTLAYILLYINFISLILIGVLGCVTCGYCIGHRRRKMNSVSFQPGQASRVEAQPIQSQADIQDQADIQGPSVPLK